MGVLGSAWAGLVPSGLVVLDLDMDLIVPFNIITSARPSTLSRCEGWGLGFGLDWLASWAR
jgi:hypothetical protein